MSNSIAGRQNPQTAPGRITVAFIEEITSRICYQAVLCPRHESSLIASQAILPLKMVYYEHKLRDVSFDLK